MENLMREIECLICENYMKTSRGCDGMCKHDEKLIEKIRELFRLAEIGKAVETATFEGFTWIIDTYSGINTCPTEENLKDLMSWYRDEK